MLSASGNHLRKASSCWLGVLKELTTWRTFAGAPVSLSTTVYSSSAISLTAMPPFGSLIILVPEGVEPPEVAGFLFSASNFLNLSPNAVSTFPWLKS